SSTYLPSSACVASAEASVSSSPMDGIRRTTAAGVAQKSSPSGPDTGTLSIWLNGEAPGPTTDSDTDSTAEKSARKAVTTRSSPGKTEHGTVSPGVSVNRRT